MEIDEIQIRLGATIRQLRIARGWTFRRAAEATGLDPSHLHRIESGTYSPHLGTLLKIADAYHMGVRSLLRRAGVR